MLQLQQLPILETKLMLVGVNGQMVLGTNLKKTYRLLEPPQAPRRLQNWIIQTTRPMTVVISLLRVIEKEGLLLMCMEEKMAILASPLTTMATRWVRVMSAARVTKAQVLARTRLLAYLANTML
jgi:hypothetical protein